MIEITTGTGSPAELLAAQRLRTILGRFDLGPWTYTSTVQVDEHAYPHSHPVLTLDAHPLSTELLLAAFVHEQLHWFEEAHTSQRDAAVVATRERYPTVPELRPDGAGSEESTRLHLLVCHWEHRSLEVLLGADEAHRTVRALAAHHYRWIYKTVQRDAVYLAELSRSHGLVPEALRS